MVGNLLHARVAAQTNWQDIRVVLEHVPKEIVCKINTLITDHFVKFATFISNTSYF